MIRGHDRALVTTVGLVVAAAGDVVAGQVWYRTAGHGFTGTELSDGAVEALSLAALAGVGVTLLLGVWGRRVVGVLIAALGLGMLLVSVLRRTPTTDQLVQVLGVRDTPGAGTAWPWIAVVLGAVTAAVGVGFVLRAHRWTSPSTRFDRDGNGRRRVVASNLDAWKALDAGDDPTDLDGNLAHGASTPRHDPTGRVPGTPTQQE